MKFINIDESKVDSFKTDARDSGKNNYLKYKYQGNTLVCERPYHHIKKLDNEFFHLCLDEDSKMIYGERLESYFDQKNRWWVHDEMCAGTLLKFFIQNPMKYFQIMSKKVQDVKKVIKWLEEINRDVDSKDSERIIRNIKKLKECYDIYYSYYSTTYIVSDELVFKFKQLLKEFLSVRDANIYFCEFLRSEITKEAVRRNAVGELLAENRSPTYSKAEPNIFYKEPKFFYDSDKDNEIIKELYNSKLSKEKINAFLALRLMIPLVIQINEEAQYIESLMLWSVARKVLDSIKNYLVDKRLIEKDKEIREYSFDEIISMLDEFKKDNYQTQNVLKDPNVSEDIITNLDEYEFIWRVDNFSYFFISYWLHENYWKTDFLMTYKDKKWRLYLSKEDRKRLSEEGLDLLKNRFPEFEKKAHNILRKAKNFFRDDLDKSLINLNNQELAQAFQKAILFFQEMWGLYFYTEYFMYDKIENNVDSLRNTIDKMGGVKLMLRQSLNKTVFGEGNLLSIYLDEIKKRVKRENLEDYHYLEIIDLLNSKQVDKKDRSGFVLGRFNNWKAILGKESLDIINILDKKHIKKENLLKGDIGNQGFHIGRVKIIPFDIKANLSRDINKMNKDDVLVAGSAGPEMILAYHKAGAIVTDEGGICSHAAIISRELGIPSVIGTKIATEILEDGDLVEVDANKGSVRIISKKP